MKRNVLLPFTASFRGRGVALLNYYARVHQQSRTKVLEAILIGFAQADRDLDWDLFRSIVESELASLRQVNGLAEPEKEAVVGDALEFLQAEELARHALDQGC